MLMDDMPCRWRLLHGARLCLNMGIICGLCNAIALASALLHVACFFTDKNAKKFLPVSGSVAFELNYLCRKSTNYLRLGFISNEHNSCNICK